MNFILQPRDGGLSFRTPTTETRISPVPNINYTFKEYKKLTAVRDIYCTKEDLEIGGDISAKFQK